MPIKQDEEKTAMSLDHVPKATTQGLFSALARAHEKFAAGDMAAAEALYRSIAADVLRSESPSRIAVNLALARWGSCLDAMGQRASAKQTRALLHRTLAQLDEEDPPFSALDPSRLLVPTASTCGFVMSLVFRDAEGAWHVTPAGESKHLRESFRFQEDDPDWLDLLLEAPATCDASYPHFGCAVTFPWDFAGSEHRGRVLELVNDMNAYSGDCSSALMAESGKVVVRARLGFAGFNEAQGSLADLDHAQQQAALNMTFAVLQTAMVWREQMAALGRLGTDSALRGQEEASMSRRPLRR